jgi:hypothetical protein
VKQYRIFVKFISAGMEILNGGGEVVFVGEMSFAVKKPLNTCLKYLFFLGGGTTHALLFRITGQRIFALTMGEVYVIVPKKGAV